MFRERSMEEYERDSESGVRDLFTLSHYQFQDTIDADGVRHHFVSESVGGDGETHLFEMDTPAIYEFMARFLAGEHEVREYRMERSPAHDELLDILEIVTARARAGEHDFSWDEFDPAETEVMDDLADNIED
ncbi:hypothetical protein BH23GEM6_BH23GEM6_19000 [soil metagenome]